MKKRRPAAGASPGAGPEPRHRPLAGIKGMIGAPPPRAAPSATPESSAGEPDADRALFREEMRGTVPIANGNRALLEKHKPAPVPRARAADEDDDEVGSERALAQPHSDAAAFAQAMAGVRPLAADNRADLSAQRRRHPIAPASRSEAPTALPAELGGTELLDWAFAGVTPLKPAERADVPQQRPLPAPRQRKRDDAEVMRESIETPLTFEDRLDVGDEAVFLRAGLPRRVLADLRRGRWVTQRELDLHGLTRDEARLALGEFLARCLVEGLRCVRLIHGKGLRSPGQFGVLRHLSRGWLAQREEILAFCQARPHEGGSGALLILLRGARSRGGGDA